MYKIILRRVIRSETKTMTMTGDVLKVPTGILVMYIGSWVPVADDTANGRKLIGICKSRAESVNDLSDIIVHLKNRVSSMGVVSGFEFHDWEYGKRMPPPPAPVRRRVATAEYEAITSFGIF